MKINVILPCGGSGSRTGLSYNKIFYVINGKTVLEKTLSAFVNTEFVDKIIVVGAENELDKIKEITAKFDADITVVRGGATRMKSVINGLAHLGECDIVVVHDGARPFVSAEIIDDCVKAAWESGAAAAAVECKDSIARASGGIISQSVNRGDFVCLQTPQAFWRNRLVEAYALAEESGENFNDESSVYDRYVGSVRLVDGSAANVKITSQEDVALYGRQRSGIGSDVHKLVPGRKLILGGVEIPHCKGLLGHSDADALLHAVMDSLLTACGLRDIGCYFPDDDESYKDISSMILLEKVVRLMRSEGYFAGNVSAVIMAEKPKLKDFIPRMTANIARVLGIGRDKVSVSATTAEGLGTVGREEGICVNAVSTVIKE